MITLPHSTSLQQHADVPLLVIDNQFAKASISLYGGQVLSFLPKGDNVERLWVSPHAHYDAKKPIRGGVPLCWPWFADNQGMNAPELPAHGYLRSQMWYVYSATDDENGTTIVLKPQYSFSEYFPFQTEVTFTIIVNSELSMALTTHNVDDKDFTYNAALHTYFNVKDIATTQLTGLSGHYKDKLQHFKRFPTPTPYTFSEHTDRIHLSSPEKLTLLLDESLITNIESYGHDSIVVWNPWQTAATMTDMDAFGYKRMLCVETACTEGVLVHAGESHTLTQVVSA